MHIDERSVCEALSGSQPGASEVGWFAARQPGVVRFLEERLLLPDGDAFGVALEGAWQIWAVFRQRDGLPPARVERSLLDRAERALLREAQSDWSLDDGCAHRQPALCRWLEAYVSNPPVPLTVDESIRVGMALAAVVYSLDEMTTGRQVP